MRRQASLATVGIGVLLTLLALTLCAPAREAAGQQVPSPEAFHGYELGTRYTITAALYDYYRGLARSSARVAYEEYGHSIQGRPLPLVTVSSEANLARLDEIRAEARRLAGADGGVTAAELEALIAESPAVVWIFIVDTDEEAGVEVLQEVAYELATSDDPSVRGIRDDVVTIFAPLTNPDSHARYITWHQLYNVDGAATDPLAIENRAHWGMNTDGNAWGVDVNRDFGWFVTPEMSALARQMMAWRPQLLLDVHSGPNTIFLPPFPRPFHPLWPEQAEGWWNAVAEQANDNFGRRGWSFKSRVDYEGVAGVGFGLSWGMLGPSVASFLFETFGGRPAKTTAFRRADGTIATMRMAMDRHKLGIYSLLEVTRDRRTDLLRDAHERVEAALAEARANSVRAVAIPASGPGVDPHKVARLVERLALQEVEVTRSDAPTRAQARAFIGDGESRSRDFPAGTYFVDLVQPNARLARALLDPTVDFSQPEVELPYRRKMPYYDAPWQNLPLMFGVGAYALGEAPPAGEAVADATGEGPGPSALAPVADVGRLDRPEPPYAWVWPQGLEASYRLTIALQREGFGVRVFRSEVRIDGETFEKGTFAALAIRNDDQLGERIEALATALGARAVPVAGPFTEYGVTFGDDQNLAPLPEPHIAVLADWPVNFDHTYGGIRSVLEGDFGLPFSPVMTATLNSADLSSYTAVVLPHAGMDVRGGPNFNAGYRGRLDLENLRAYVRGGGTVIAAHGAAAYLAQDEVLGRGLSMDGWAEETEGTARAEWISTPRPEGDVVPWRPGLAELGLPMLAAGHTGSEFAAPASFPVLLSLEEGGGARVVARYSPDVARLALDGFIPPWDAENIAGRPFALVQPVGRGRVVLFAEDVTFRGAWYGMNTLFLNALLFGGEM
jgi:hypothetical protein